MTTYAPHQDPPFYGPNEGVILPANLKRYKATQSELDGLIPPGLAAEIEAWAPLPGDVDWSSNQGNSGGGGYILNTQRFQQACENIFKKKRVFVNSWQVRECANRLSRLWGSTRQTVTHQQVLTMHCRPMQWQTRMWKVAGQGKGHGYFVKSQLAKEGYLDHPGVKVVSLQSSEPLVIERRLDKKQMEESDSDSDDNEAITVLKKKEVAKKKKFAWDPSEPQNLLTVEQNPRDVDLKSSDGVTIPAHKSVLSLGSPFFKVLFQSAASLKEVQIPFPYVVIREAMKATYFVQGLLYDETEFDESVLEEYLYDCLSLASQFRLEAFQEFVNEVFSESLTVDNIKKGLKVAQQHNDLALMQVCLRYVQKNASPVLMAPSLASLASENPSLWKELVLAALLNTNQQQQARAMAAGYANQQKKRKLDQANTKIVTTKKKWKKKSITTASSAAGKNEEENDEEVDNNLIINSKPTVSPRAARLAARKAALELDDEEEDSKPAAKETATTNSGRSRSTQNATPEETAEEVSSSPPRGRATRNSSKPENDNHNNNNDGTTDADSNPAATTTTNKKDAADDGDNDNDDKNSDNNDQTLIQKRRGRPRKDTLALGPSRGRLGPAHNVVSPYNNDSDDGDHDDDIPIDQLMVV